MHPSLELQNLAKRYLGHLAVDGISLRIAKGGFFSLLGPSGCGKTTTLRLVAGFEEPTAGEVWLNGALVNGRRPYERNVSTVFQNYALFPHLTALENIEFGLRERGVRDRAARVREALEMVRLTGKESRYPSQLSGGERQRVALARSLVLEPEVLLLDEPLAALDPKLRHEMRVELKELQRRVGITFLFVTHDQEEAMSMSDSIAVMNQGRVEQVGTPQQVYDKPATPFVYQFLGNVNVLKVPAAAGALVGAGRPPEAARDGQIYVRPHDIELTSHEVDGEGLSAIVRHLHAAGPHARLLLEQVQTREQVEVEISRSELSNLNLKVNDLVRMRLRQAHSFDEDYAI